GVVYQGVLHVDQDVHAGVAAGELLHDQHRHEERASQTPQRLRYFDYHQPQLEEAGDQRLIDLLLRVHRLYARPNFDLLELSHGVAEHFLLFGQHRERCTCDEGLRSGHHLPPSAVVRIGGMLRRSAGKARTVVVTACGSDAQQPEQPRQDGEELAEEARDQPYDGGLEDEAEQQHDDSWTGVGSSSLIRSYASGRGRVSARSTPRLCCRPAHGARTATAEGLVDRSEVLLDHHLPREPPYRRLARTLRGTQQFVAVGPQAGDRAREG